MLLCLDVGNTHIVGGLFIAGKIKFRFRYATGLIGTSDQFGIFLENFFKSNSVNIKEVLAVALSSVVPSYNFTIHHTISSYMPRAKYFMLTFDSISDLIDIKYDSPNEVGADLLAGAIGASELYTGDNLIIIDLGTATTITAVSNKKEFLGGVIMPGLKLAVDSLTKNAARLTEVDIEIPKKFLGGNTKACIQSGIYFGHIGAIKEVILGYKREVFNKDNSKVKIIATGGFASLFASENIFDSIEPDLVLIGLKMAYEQQI